jgi:threonine dehydratase
MAPSFAAIQAAHAAIRPRVAVTPLVVSHALSARLGCTVALKCEHLHPTGAFKYRGATNRIAHLSPAERAAGIITASTGNHGLAAAMAGALADYLAAIART